MAQLKSFVNYNLLFFYLLVITVNNGAKSNETVKKVLHVDNKVPEESVKPQEKELPRVNTDKNQKQSVETGELVTATFKNASAANASQSSTDALKQQKKEPFLPEQREIIPKERWQNTIEESKFNRKQPNFDYEEDALPDSYITGFYIFLALSGGAMIFIVIKVYRLRLSRAERKYGVQGDRSTQELVPLPISVEDGVSEDEDQTLFEVNRQHIRIL